MAFRPGERVRPQLALNAIRVLTPPGTIPASVVPFDRALLHAYLDRSGNDVFATRHDGTDMAVVPLTAGANLPTDTMELPAAEHLRLVSALTREAVFRLLAASPEAGLLIRRRPPTVAGKRQNVLAEDVGLPAYDAADPETYREPFTATLTTDQGDVVVEMAAAEAPCTTNSFRHLATEKYFDDTSCHRLTTGGIFVLQCGDPTGSGSGGPGYQFPEENVPAEEDANYPAGTVAMANAGPGTNGSQFFLVYEDTTLPPGYTIFGTITEGLDVVRAVAEKGVDGGGGDGKPAQPVTIERVRLGTA